MNDDQNPKGVDGRPRRGDFGWQPLASAFEPTLEDMMSDRSYFGMLPEALYLWGTFRDEDGEIHCPMRRIPARMPGAAKDTRRRFYLCSTLGHEDGMHMHAAGRTSVPNDNCRRTLEADRIHWRSDPAQPGNPFHVTWTPDDCNWVEEGAMDVRGRLVKPGMHWYLPGRDAGMYYVANIFEMEGTILGRKVRGMIGFDPIYMFEGGEIYKSKDALVQEQLELVWYTWATRYKDGSIDFGHFTLGNDMFGFAILGNEKGEVRYTYDVTGDVDFGTNGYWQEGIRILGLRRAMGVPPGSEGTPCRVRYAQEPAGRRPLAPRRRHPRAGRMVRLGRGCTEPRHATGQSIPRPRHYGSA